MASNIDLVRGTLDLLVLHAIKLEPNLGLGIGRRIGELTRNTFEVKPGSLFPALHRLEAKGWLQSSWGKSANNRRAKYYSLTRPGRRVLHEESANWARLSQAISHVVSLEELS